MNLGLISVSFRALSPEEIIDLTVRSGLSCIEWGADVHVPDADAARRVGQRTRQAGLSVSSYGSYFRVGEDDLTAFPALVENAAALGAPIIRVWAGRRAPKDADAAYYQRVLSDTQTICDLAQSHGIRICFEYHPNTLTEDCTLARRLILESGKENLHLYWQPNPTLSVAENCDELRTVLPYVINVHVFAWKTDYSRLPLESGCSAWNQYFKILKTARQMPDAFLEFVLDDDPAQLLQDAAVLRRIFAG